MKICVCSDSHGNHEGVTRMLARERPQALLFLGDGLKDFEQVRLPEDMLFWAVAGNCDWTRAAPQSRTLTLLDRTIYMTHGHGHRVKSGLAELGRAALAAGAKIALYGHTHIAGAEERDGCLLLCPGAMADRQNRYAVLWEEAGVLRHAFKMADWGV